MMTFPFIEHEVAATRPICYTLYRGTFVQTPRLGELKVSFNSLIGVDRSGTIDYIYEDFSPEEDSDSWIIDFYIKERDLKGDIDKTQIKYVDVSRNPLQFFCPGFVDTHIHASQYPNCGIGLESQLLEWLKVYTYPLEASFTDHNKNKYNLAQDVYSKVVKRCLASGTTCASYFATIDPDTTTLLGKILLLLGQRGLIGKVCLDENPVHQQYQEDVYSCAESMESIIKSCEHLNPKNEDLIKPVISPRFAPVCSRELLQYLGSLANNLQLSVQTHISESKDENQLVTELFPECKNYASVYDNFSLLTSKTILAHGVYLSEAERKLVKGRNCSISHCPTSNSFISSGEAPVKKYMYEDKINMSFGTDVSGGYSPSILEVMKHSLLVSHHLAMKTNSKSEAEEVKLTIADVLYMATRGGAKAVGMLESLGTFEKGKRWDTQLIDLGSYASNVDVFEWQLPKPSSHATLHSERRKLVDLLGKWIFTGDDRNCIKVWCNGRLVIEKE